MTATLAVDIGEVELANPIMPASGTFGSGGDFQDFYDPACLGAVVSKSITLNPTRGNPPPRVTETPSGMLNAIGLQNGGLTDFVDNILPDLRQKAKRLVASVAGHSEADYQSVVERLAATPVDALEINISCPNVKAGGMAFGVSPHTAGGLVAKLRRAAGAKPLWVKLTPNVTDIVEIALAVEAAGADALVVANTFVGMAVDIESRRPILGNLTGGLSGPAIHPLALRLVYATAQAVRCPVIGVGGIQGVTEVVAFLLAGARAVQVGSAALRDPGLLGRLPGELAEWLTQHQTRVKDIIGGLGRA
ncbi:MAG: dihydroorotate dehydrogenase [Planctomycetota bacterium]|jgi:dihydroorotate dehydrogenase (NAD+) catalytic subunit|nr:dihydroorotate dehydrogenase [Planctomycetota bacterium]